MTRRPGVDRGTNYMAESVETKLAQTSGVH